MLKKFPQRDPGLMLDLSRERLSTQLEFVDAIEAKLGLFLGVSSGLAAILVGTIAVQTQDVGPWAIVGLSTSVLAYLALASTCIAGLWPRSWKAAIDIDQVYRDHYTVDQHAIGWELFNTYTSFFRKNRKSYNRKVLALRLASIGLVFQTVLLIGTLLLVLGRV